MSKNKTKKELDEMLNDYSENQPKFFKFAYCGRDENRIKYFTELKEMAEVEKWSNRNEDEEASPILTNYIVYTFEKAFDECNILFSNDDDWCCFNTGLLTENGEDIICLFNKFDGSNKFVWHLYGFRKESDRDFMNKFEKTPSVVKYFDEASTLYFDPTKEIVKNMDHIIDDNIDRFPEDIQQKGKNYIIFLLTSSLELTIKRCKRNYRIAVPCYYKHNITFLLPIDIDGNKMAVAVELLNNRYRVNTIFSLDMAYKQARLLMKPEADWLNI